MPQMAPMWWTILFTMFMVSFLLFIVMMYFNFYKMIKNPPMTEYKKKIHWKW